ncbi:glycosyltransferase [Sphingomonas sp.]|uniref:glycosyltransferase n=1 Tax=Sphingomonas sp. TaxID=28214 RepID=UPI0038AC40F7
MKKDGEAIWRIYVDARCLQDARFRERGIGQHVLSVLAGAHEFAPVGVTPHLIACVDRSLPPLEANARALFAGEQALSVPMKGNSTLLQLSPMTHSPHPLSKALENPTIRTISIVYDFIPFDFPSDYLTDPVARKEYLTNLAVLHDYDAYISISEFTSGELQKNLGVMPRNCYVSGVAVRESVIRFGSCVPSGEHYCLVVGGGDKRKNVELPIRAHARSSLLRRSNVSLKIVGHYSKGDHSELCDLHRREGGATHLLQFIDGISDADLATLYQCALVTVCPSRAEGFSIPVVEANANGCPVIVADCDAQVELMPLPEYQVDPDDYDRARALMESFLDPRAGELATKRQGNFWKRFQLPEVQQRFWSAFFEQHFENVVPIAPVQGAPYVKRNFKPRLAIASPVPPDRSGVADYTVATMTAVARHADLDLYTETNGRIINRAFNMIQPLSAEPYTNRNYDGVISVLGNSHLHLQTFNLLLNYGGAAIAHDARMLHFYVSLLGADRARAVASHELGRPVTIEEIHGWIANQRSMPILFLSEILEASQPTFVHSPTTQKIIRDLYGRETIDLPFATYRAQPPEFRGAEGQARARALLGYDEDDRLLICLGDLVPDKAPEECLWTASIMHRWSVPIRLAFVGNSQPNMVAYLQSIADLIDMGSKVRFSESVVDERTYQAYLAAADAAIQLRNYEFGGLSGAMLDGIAAGVPTIANEHLAEAMESPSYVARIPNGLSPVLAAEKLLEIFDRDRRADYEEERNAFLEAHSVDAYAKRLMNGMGFA